MNTKASVISPKEKGFGSGGHGPTGVLSPQPKWAKYHGKMSSEFPSPFRGTEDPLAHQIEKFVERLDKLRPEKGGPAYLGKSGALTYKYPDVKNVEIPEKMGDLDAVLDDVVKLFEGAVNWGNPLTMCNVIPQPNTAAVIASMLSQVFPANILEGEYAQNVHIAELETAGMLGNLVGWNPVKTGAIYTWGGGGCWTYGLKYGLTRVLPDSMHEGRTHGRQGHLFAAGPFRPEKRLRLDGARHGQHRPRAHRRRHQPDGRCATWKRSSRTSRRRRSPSQPSSARWERRMRVRSIRSARSASCWTAIPIRRVSARPFSMPMPSSAGRGSTSRITISRRTRWSSRTASCRFSSRTVRRWRNSATPTRSASTFTRSAGLPT